MFSVFILGDVDQELMGLVYYVITCLFSSPFLLEGLCLCVCVCVWGEGGYKSHFVLEPCNMDLNEEP